MAFTEWETDHREHWHPNRRRLPIGECAGQGRSHPAAVAHGRSLRLRCLTGDPKNEGGKFVKPWAQSMSETGGKGSGLSQERERGPVWPEVGLESGRQGRWPEVLPEI